MTEGECEKGILDAILEKNLLKYEQQELFYEQIFHLRQIRDKQIIMFNQLPKNEMVTIIRVGDTLTDELKIPRDIKNKVVEIIDIYTKPELEMIYIIHKNKFNEFIKIKSKVKASIFLKQIDDTYEKTYDYHYNYFMNLSNEEIYNLLKKYDLKRGKTHAKKDTSLSYLLKKGD